MSSFLLTPAHLCTDLVKGRVDKRLAAFLERVGSAPFHQVQTRPANSAGPVKKTLRACWDLPQGTEGHRHGRGGGQGHTGAPWAASAASRLSAISCVSAFNRRSSIASSTSRFTNRHVFDIAPLQRGACDLRSGGSVLGRGWGQNTHRRLCPYKTAAKNVHVINGQKDKV